MKIQAGQAGRFCCADQPAYHAVLLYGPDGGRVRERAKQLAQAVTKGDPDPFLSAIISAKTLDENPSALSDEALQLSLTGGRRAVTLEGAADTHAGSVKSLLSATLPLPALVILSAGELTPRSKLRTLFEKQATLAAVATYADDARSLGDTIRDWSRATKRQISREAEALLIQSLGGDRALTRLELEKLSVYMLSEPADRRIETADVQACLAGMTTIDRDDALFAALAGNTPAALIRLSEALDQGHPPEALVASYLYHLTRLSDAQALMQSGISAQDAVGKLRPPVFFQKKAAVGTQLSRLAGSSGDRLSRFYAMALELQKQVRTGREQAPLHIERFLMRIGHFCKARF